ncbi:cytochrome c oxidase subunit 3 [Paracoccus sp. YLB-12]|uniref:Cytochrome c oxidase subunit 3 n=1 Tax=Paracoccus maritimus TaxID=2933292 RepID=A0ABT2KDX8_9RHOB|nr:cytochrome c oxidase subunit 3 [Paracoccus sp. YLB-12]MCT4334747.1 cytochrome c oxidase subunit 3 [Paracoccus sp. YLB-12]
MSQNLHPGLNLGASHGDAHQQSELSVFGFWVFLMSDLITFGVLFATYAASSTPIAMAGGPGPAALFDLTSTGMQTAFLLASSLTCGMASLALKYREGPRRIALWLAVTALLGAGFLALELRDFADMIAKGATPMRSGWLSSLYALVGLHGLHITAGLVWIVVLLLLIWRRGVTDLIKTRLLIFALYWHFLDLVWIGIFSVVFLRGLA